MLPLRQLDQATAFITASTKFQSYKRIVCAQWQADRGRCRTEARVSARI
jgi:hypothetical protein